MKKFIFCGLLLSSIAFAENINQLIDKALEVHPKLKAINQKLEAYKAKQIFEGSLVDPVVSFSINDIQLFYKPLSRTLEPMQTINLGISQNIPYFNKLDLKKEIVKQLYNSEYYRLQKEKLEIVYQIYKNSLLYWQYKEKLKIIREYKKIAKHLIDFSNTLYSVGKVSQAEVFNAQVFYSQLLEKEKYLENKIKQTKAKLEYYLSFEVEDVSILPKEPEKLSNLNSLKERLVENNPEILSLREKLNQNNLQIKLARLDYKPDFNVFAGYSYRKGFRDYISFGVSFNLPIWKKTRQDKKVLEFSYEKSKTKKEIEDLKIKLISNLEDSFYKLKSSYESYEIFKNLLIPQTTKVYESIISEYEVGSKNIFDVLKSLNQILNIKLKIIDEITTYNISYKNIQKLTGDIK